MESSSPQSIVVQSGPYKFATTPPPSAQAAADADSSPPTMPRDGSGNRPSELALLFDQEAGTHVLVSRQRGELVPRVMPCLSPEAVAAMRASFDPSTQASIEQQHARLKAKELEAWRLELKYSMKRLAERRRASGRLKPSASWSNPQTQEPAG